MQKTGFKSTFFFIFLVLISIIIYLNILPNGFVYDDEILILKNKWIKDITYLPEIFFSSSWSFKEGTVANTYRPLQHVLGMLEYGLFGLKPWGYHLTSILFHAINTILVFLVASLIIGTLDVRYKMQDARNNSPFNLQSSIFNINIPPAFIAALLFASHPIHTEAVAWASAITGLAMASLYLLSLYLYISLPQGFNGKFCLSVLSFLVAIFFKESAITLPIILMVYDYSQDGVSFVKKRYKGYLFYLLVIALYMEVRLYSLGGFSVMRTLPLTNYEILINVFPLFSQYMEKLILPVSLSAHYPLIPAYSIMEWKALISLIFVICLFGLLYVTKKKDLVVFFCLSMTFVPLLPFFYLPGLGASAFAERYLYIPSIGYVILCAHVGNRVYWWLVKNNRMSLRVVKIGFTCIVSVIVGLYSILTVERNYDWKDGYTLWFDTVQKQPLSSLAHANLGLMYERKRLLGRAVEEYKAALELNPGEINTRYALGMLYFQFNLFQEAMVELHEILKIEPDNREALEGIKKISSIVSEMKER